jgi:hypothetical protein
MREPLASRLPSFNGKNSAFQPPFNFAVLFLPNHLNPQKIRGSKLGSQISLHLRCPYRAGHRGRLCHPDL